MLVRLCKREIRDALYELERGIYNAQPVTVGYMRRFEYEVTLTNTEKGDTEQVRVVGVATCTATFGFNVYPIFI